MDVSLPLVKLRDLERNKLDLIRRCQQWGLLQHDGTYKCSKCGNDLVLTLSSRIIDGYSWCCNRSLQVKRKRKRCGVKISIRSGTFFEKSHLSIAQILGFVSMWVESYKLKHITFQLSITKTTAIDWASFCREVAFHAMVENQEPIGGDGKIVEINESKFTKRKFNVGHIVRDNWVFGGIERGSGKIFMIPVEDRSRQTLINIINKWILPGTKIISDCWRSYDSLSEEGNIHENVKHSLHFVDPVTGAHTNSIESMWNAAKMSISPQNRKTSSLAGNLARYMLIKKAKAEGLDPVLYFYKLAGQLYNPLLQREVEIGKPGSTDQVKEKIDEDNDVEEDDDLFL